jgi:hypothetical protein
MLKKITLATGCFMAASTGALYLESRTMLRRLPGPSRVPMEGITTIEDAVEACRRSGLQGWDLVAYAQQLTARKFTYSRLNTWERPSRAFERGRGYCEQQALALKQIYDRLGIETRPVFSLHCRFGPKVVDGVLWPGGVTGHAWLRVRIDGEERDVCPGLPENRPGVTNFVALKKPRTWSPWLRPFTHIGSSIENIRRDVVARRGVKRAEQTPGRVTPSAQPA